MTVRFQFPRPSGSFGVDAMISAPGFFPRECHLTGTHDVCDFVLNTGSTVTGRLVKDGVPLAGIKLELLPLYHMDHVYRHRVVTKTNAKGEFTFEHVPDHTLFEMMAPENELKMNGVMPRKRIRTEQSDAHIPVGDITSRFPAFACRRN